MNYGIYRYKIILAKGPPLTGCVVGGCAVGWGAKFTPYEHEYAPGNTHIYAYGSHSYLGNTHVSVQDYK